SGQNVTVGAIHHLRLLVGNYFRGNFDNFAVVCHYVGFYQFVAQKSKTVFVKYHVPPLFLLYHSKTKQSTETHKQHCFAYRRCFDKRPQHLQNNKPTPPHTPCATRCCL